MFLLDEPSSNLDFESEQNIFELLENIKNQKQYSNFTFKKIYRFM